jgi:NAD(P)-dependent dehydrogenase (short-subunit alcohol dehydrogenase family)
VADGRRAETAGNGARGSFTGKLAAVTGGGSGMGRELVRQLAAQGCSVAACDWHADTVAETPISDPGHERRSLAGQVISLSRCALVRPARTRS